MSNLTGVHDSQFCATDNGQPCVMCAWAEAVSSYIYQAPPPPTLIRKEIDQWDLMRELNDFDTRYGRQALLEQIFQFMGARC